MQVTSSRQLETYLYSSVLMPLKRLNLDFPHFPSPIKGESGSTWNLQVRRAELTRRYRRNYQRRQAEEERPYEIWLTSNSEQKLVGVYDQRRRVVKLAERPFRDINAMFIYGKLHKMFIENRPFAKIIVKDIIPTPRPRQFRNPLAQQSETVNPFNPFGEDIEYDEYVDDI